MGTRLQFGILGPLEVRRAGAPVSIGGPRQRALLALLLFNANRVVSRDRLIDELLPDQAARSPERMLRVQVSRLRKALAVGGDESRVVACPPGYLLRVEAGELDLHTFEELVRGGRAALERDDQGRASEVLREAEGLWRGRALADLEFEPFARIEIQRLEELRLLALEDRIEAELALGQHAALCAELTMLTSEYPLRERLRGQLMLALYRSDRQADALAVYRQTGEMLREELGLDPSPLLRELERSILKQDASLDRNGGAAVAIRSDLALACPFKGLEFFDRADAAIFFGRERIVAELLARLAEASLVGILGPSGIGKSSILRAGALSALSAGELPGSAGWRQVLLRPGEHPSEQLTHELGNERVGESLARLMPGERLVIAVDQLEELFTACSSEREREDFLEELVLAASDDERRGLVLVALRGDFYVRFASHPRFAELLSRNHMLIGPMDRRGLAQAIEQPATRAGLEIERPLVEELVSEASGHTGGLPLLSATLLELWSTRDGPALSYESYEASGGLHAAVARLAEAAYERLGARQRSVSRSVMLRLAVERDGALTRRRVPVAELARIDGANPVVAALIDARLLTISDGKVELSHEALLREWPRYRAWLEEDRTGRRLHGHLTAAAGEWDARGRDPGELYRGARLVAALEWAGHQDDRLNSLERDFLDRSRVESQRLERRQRSQNRRLRGLLIAAGVLLLVAVGAGIVARIKQQRASDEARSALGRQLGAEAVNEPRLDLAMLMAREAVNLDGSPQTQSSLLATLLRSPAVIGLIALPSETGAALGFSPDGRTLAAADSLGDLRLFDARTHAMVAPAVGETSADQPPTYSNDGALLAYLAPGACSCAYISVSDARTLQPVASLSLPAGAPPAPSDIPGGSIAITPDDRALYYVYWVVDGARDHVTAYLQRWALPSGKPISTTRIGANALLAMRLVDRGARLVTVSRDSFSEFDTNPLRLLRRVMIRPTPVAPETAAISPDGRTIVIGSRAGTVSFVDTSTGAIRQAAEGQGAAVRNVLYPLDERTVVTVGDDDSVIDWNPVTATPDHVLTGPPGQVSGAALSPDGKTLYTSSLNGLLLEWDLGWDRRLGRSSTLAPPAGACCESVAPPTTPLALAPGGGAFAIRAGPSTVGLFSSSGFRRLASFTVTPREHAITALAWSPAGNELAVGGDSGLVQLWTTTGIPRLVRSLIGLRSILGQPEAIQSVAFSPGGRLLAASDVNRSGTVQSNSIGDYASVDIWQAATGRLLASPQGLNGALADGVQPLGDDLLAFSPDRKLLAVSMFDGSILILTSSTGQLLQALPSTGGTTSLAFAPNGTLAAGTPSGTVEFWNPLRARQIGTTLVVAATPVTAVAFDPSGRRFVTAGRGEGTVKLWLTATRQQQGLALSTEPGATPAIAFEPGGQSLLAVDDSGRGYSWPMSVRVWEQQACTVAGRGFTREEWSQLALGRNYTPVCP